jgi:ubiquinone/menaquinone biosynthesis C-methylase UbiE
MDPVGDALFEGDALADGYESARPPLHAPIMERIAAAAGWPDAGEPVVRTVVDVGCGAGASTAAVRPWADRVVGVDPAAAMVRRAAHRHRDARFAIASGVALPFRSGSVDAIVAAGALNFMDLTAFRREAARAVRAGGVVLVYDFATGSRSPTDPQLARAYGDFAQRWPRPVATRHPVDPAVLAGAGFVLRAQETFVLTLTMSGDDYLRYLMTETNVVGGVAAGHRREDIARWCERRFATVFAVSRPIEFDCWYAVVEPGGSADHPGEQ